MILRSMVVTTALALAALTGLPAPAGADVIVAGYFESSILRFAEDGKPMQPIVPPGGMSGSLENRLLWREAVNKLGGRASW